MSSSVHYIKDIDHIRKEFPMTCVLPQSSTATHLPSPSPTRPSSAAVNLRCNMKTTSIVQMKGCTIGIITCWSNKEWSMGGMQVQYVQWVGTSQKSLMSPNVTFLGVQYQRVFGELSNSPSTSIFDPCFYNLMWWSQLAGCGGSFPRVLQSLSTLLVHCIRLSGQLRCLKKYIILYRANTSPLLIGCWQRMRERERGLADQIF